MRQLSPYDARALQSLSTSTAEPRSRTLWTARGAPQSLWFFFFLIFKCTFWLYVRIHSKTDFKNVYVEFRIESLLHYDLLKHFKLSFFPTLFDFVVLMISSVGYLIHLATFAHRLQFSLLSFHFPLTVIPSQCFKSLFLI